MKFLTWINHREGDAFPTNSFLSFGRMIQEELRGDPYRTVEAFNGFYIMLQLPYKEVKRYVDSNGFLFRRGPCRPTWLLMRREPKFTGKRKTFKTFVWAPVDPLGGVPDGFVHTQGTDLGAPTLEETIKRGMVK